MRAARTALTAPISMNATRAMTNPSPSEVIEPNHAKGASTTSTPGGCSSTNCPYGIRPWISASAPAK